MNAAQPLERHPQYGPSVLTIPGITDRSVAGNTVGPEVRFTWPKGYVVESFCVTVRSANVVELANTKLRMVDEQPSNLQIDGNAFTIRANVLALVGRAAPLLGLGSQLRWFSFRRLVRAGEVWIFQIENQNAGAIIPWLGFRVAELIG